MKLTEIALGSKAHHELVAQANRKNTTITVGEFKKKLNDSTMPMMDTTKIDDALDGVKDSKIMTRFDVEQICAMADVDLGEVLDIIALDEAKATDTAVKGKKFIVIGNPGRSMPSALYPKTEAPKLYTEAEAKRICAKMNETKPGAPHSPVHWHYKSLDVAMGYISGTKAGNAIRKLLGSDDSEGANDYEY